MQVFHYFHQALADNGLLLLGEYELPLQEARSLFSALDFDTRLHRKVQSNRILVTRSIRRHRGKG